MLSRRAGNLFASKLSGVWGDRDRLNVASTPSIQLPLFRRPFSKAVEPAFDMHARFAADPDLADFVASGTHDCQGSWSHDHGSGGLTRSASSADPPHAFSSAFGSRYAVIPHRPISRPSPECLKPPNGARGSCASVLISTRPESI